MIYIPTRPENDYDDRCLTRPEYIYDDALIPDKVGG